MKLHFYGGAGEVTGSHYILETEKYKIAVDCGLFQGARFAEEKNKESLPYEPAELDAVILTHAHLDHCGRLPWLRKNGFKGKIFATPATIELAELIMTDAAEVMLHELEDDGSQPLYLAVDVAQTMPLFVPVEYRTITEILPGVSLELYDAGHILGSATAVVSVEGQRFAFSGDLGNHPVPILREPDIPTQADYVVMETTYGGRIHEGSHDRRAKLRSVIRQAVERKGALLIPAFALERTQEILYELGQLVEEGSVPAIPMFLDSPLAIAATAVYYRYKHYFDPEAAALLSQGVDLFKFPQLRITESVAQSKSITQFPVPKVIIAGSGMMEGGRIIHHAKNYLADASTTLLFVGYQGVGTLGRRIFDGDKRVKVLGQWVTVNAHRIAIGAYSAHADQPALIDWLEHFGTSPKQVFLTHGEEGEAAAFAQAVGDRYQTVIPKQNQVIEL